MTTNGIQWVIHERLSLVPDGLLRGPGMLSLLAAAGMIVFFALPWFVDLAARMEVTMARPRRREVLAGQVAWLLASRAAVLEAAATERHRIARDLHDGAQQRLLSIATNLRRTRAVLAADVPEAVREIIERAHDDARQALAGLRDVVRTGLPPAALDDGGLPAALADLTAASPVPAGLRVDLAHRPSAAVERVAYLTVAEALRNVARHAAADRVDVIVEHPGPRLVRVVVSDDGHGGADPGAGVGLRVVARRVDALDGTVTLDSPAGGPTVLVVELPCAS